MIREKRNTFDGISALYGSRELTLNVFRTGIFPIKARKGERRLLDLATRLKMLAPKRVLQRLPKALTQVKESNTSEKLLDEIRQIIYTLYRSKEITKKVCNNVIN